LETPTSESKELGRLVRTRRETLGLGLRELAERVSFDVSRLSRLEQGKVPQPTTQLLQRLARVLELPLTDLYVLAGHPTPMGLPEFRPYLRAKSHLPDEAIAELEALYRELEQRFADDQRRGGRHE